MVVVALELWLVVALDLSVIDAVVVAEVDADDITELENVLEGVLVTDELTVLDAVVYLQPTNSKLPNAETAAFKAVVESLQAKLGTTTKSSAEQVKWDSTLPRLYIATIELRILTVSLHALLVTFKTEF